MDKIVALMLYIIMPQGIPDASHLSPVKDATECWEKAHEFTERGVTAEMKARGAIGVGAGCMVVQKPKDMLEQEQQEKKQKQPKEDSEDEKGTKL